MKYPRALPCFALILACSAGWAGPGEPDPRFSDDGVALVGFGGNVEFVNALLPDADNAVFAAGRLQGEPPDPNGKGGALCCGMTVVRLLGDGSLDPSWGAGGYAQVSFGGNGEGVSDMLRLGDGSLLVAGALQRGAAADFGVARFTAEGFPDELFGELPNAGKGVAPRLGAMAFHVGPDENANSWAVALAVQSDDHIVLAGTGYTADGHSRFGLARVTPEGRLDDTFPGGGWFLVDPLYAEASEDVFAIARRSDGTLTPDDGFVVVGMSSGPRELGGARALLRRFRADGTPDPQFGSNGTVAVQAGTGDAAGTGMFLIVDAAIDAHGRIVVVGSGNDRGFAFMRFNADGTIDDSFGVDGRQHVKFSGESDYDHALALTLQADGKIVAAGDTSTRTADGMPIDFASARLLRNGAIDTGYGDGAGRATHALGPGADSAMAVTITSDGSVLLAGRVVGDAGNEDMAFLRLQGDPTVFADGFEN